MIHPIRSLSLLACAIALTACGGGSSTYTVGGTLTGLNGTLVLQLNAANDLTLTANGAFAFGAKFPSGTAYNVTVKTQPSAPAQSCVVTSGSGTLSTANVSTVSIACTTLLAVTSTTPADNAVSVLRTTTPVIQFSAALNAATITNTNITLSSAAGAASAAFAVSGSQVTVTPASRLLPLKQYTLTITTGVRGQAGEILPTAVTRQFTSRDGVWGTPALAETDASGDAQFVRMAMDASGNALAVWRTFDGTRRNIWANRYVAGVGWGVATLIETDAGDAINPQVAMDASGNGIAVWEQFDGTRGNIWANRYVVGVGWGTAAMIETDNAGNAGIAQVAVAAGGNAFAVWVQSDGTRTNIWSNRYVLGTGWGTATLIETDNAGNAGVPYIAVDTAGNALAVWEQTDGTRYNIWANRYVSGGSWGTAAVIETDNNDAANHRFAADASGNAFAVWQQHDGTRYNVWASRYVAGTTWSAPVLIETDNAGTAFAPRISLDTNGNALAVWEQSDGTRFNIWGNRYVAGIGWSTAALIETDNAGNAARPQIAVDATGSALATWEQSDGTRVNIQSNRFE
jgi:hypothetical protein